MAQYIVVFTTLRGAVLSGGEMAEAAKEPVAQGGSFWVIFKTPSWGILQQAPKSVWTR